MIWLGAGGLHEVSERTENYLYKFDLKALTESPKSSQ
jgi:hypothetical protein